MPKKLNIRAIRSRLKDVRDAIWKIEFNGCERLKWARLNKLQAELDAAYDLVKVHPQYELAEFVANALTCRTAHVILDGADLSYQLLKHYTRIWDHTGMFGNITTALAHDVVEFGGHYTRDDLVKFLESVGACKRSRGCGIRYSLYN
jgi:hypothetical protein